MKLHYEQPVQCTVFVHWNRLFQCTVFVPTSLLYSAVRYVLLEGIIPLSHILLLCFEAKEAGT
jgi:hypothetical protein